MKYRRVVILLLVVIGSVNVFAQTPEEEYENFRKKATSEYTDFRNKCNAEYVNFIRRAWKEFLAKPAIPKPKEEKVPPIVCPIKERQNPIKDNPKPITVIVPPVVPKPQPQPVEPIKEMPQPVVNYYTFSFFKTSLKVRLDDTMHFALRDCSENSIADVWQTLSGEKYNNVIKDCLDLRQEHNLCDWGYLLLLQTLADNFCGKNTNESTLLMAYIYCQSGYKMRLAQNNGRIYMMYASQNNIYDRSYYVINGEMFYPLNCKEGSLYVCQAFYPKESFLELNINKEQLFDVNKTAVRVLQSKAYPSLKVAMVSNKNLIDFYDTYPTSSIHNDFGTRWAYYANTPLSNMSKQQLYPMLQAAIMNKGQKEAANMILNFVQTAFVYKYDDDVWGHDRAFFGDETLFYPYCDCEDRAILFSQLVRDLMKLKVVLIYYPGHLATAVRFTDEITGDYVTIGGDKYVICDPTYINAPIGLTMPGMNNSTSKAIELE